MLNEKPTFLSKIRTVSCGDILWAFFCRPWESILMSSMCTTLLGCVSISPNVSPLCQPNTRQLSTIVFEISNKISISDVEFCQFKGGGVVEITLPFTISLKKTFVKKCCEIFIQNFQKSFHVGNFAWKFQVCDCVNWTIFGLVFF